MAKKPDKAKKAQGKPKSASRNRSATKDSYTGRSGQLAVMAELLMLKCNVAIPEVDEGRDVFAFMEGREEVAHIQVKTAQGKKYKKEEGYRAVFSIPKKELHDPRSQPPIFYALAARLGGDWADFIIISRERIAEDYWNRANEIPQGVEGSPDFVFTVQFRPLQVLCVQIDWTGYRNAWQTLPPFQPPLEFSLTSNETVPVTDNPRVEVRPESEQSLVEPRKSEIPAEDTSNQPPT
jgi:hypothetical protein